MNLYNLVLWMVDQIISYQIAHVPPYLGIRGILIFFNFSIFADMIRCYTNLYKICAILSCITKNKGMYELVSYELYDQTNIQINEGKLLEYLVLAFFATPGQLI